MLSYKGSTDVAEAEDSSSMDESSFLDTTVSPISLIESPGRSRKFSEYLLDATNDQENYDPLLERSPAKSGNSCDIFETIDDIPETPESVKIIDLSTRKGTSENGSPLLSTQSPPKTMLQRSRTCNGTLDGWIKRFEPLTERTALNTHEYDSWLNISPDVSPEKQDLMAKTNKQSNKCAERTVRGCSSSQISSESLISCTGIPACKPVELGSPTSNNTECLYEKIAGYAQISPQLLSQSIPKRMSAGSTASLDSSVVLRSPGPVVYTSQGETKSGRGQLDNSSPVSDGSALPLTPSPPKIIRKPETLKQVSLATKLNESNIAACYAEESQHTRSLMKAVSSPTFCRNDWKYVDSELNSRFADDGKVRRRKAERRLLHGFDCRCCADYYEALGLSGDERNKRIDQVSKHRDIAKGPSTPEYYWEIGMPNREEQRRRGQIIESYSPIALKARCAQRKSKGRARRRLSFSN